MIRLLMLRIYRHHSAACAKKLKATYKKLKPAMQRRAIRAYTTCDCAIWMTGTTDTEKYPRQATGLRDWAVAEVLKRSTEAGAKDTTVHGPTLADCIQTFLDARAEHISARALSQYKRTLGKLQTFAHGKNRYFMAELNVDLLEGFKTYALANLASTSKAGAVEKIKFFLAEAYRREWTREALALKMKSVAAVYEEKKPYSEKEVTAILNEAPKLNGGRTGYAANGGTFRLLLEFMLETGLRVSDAVRFDPKKCTKSEHLWVYTFQPKKQRIDRASKYVNAYLDTKLKTAIDKTEWFSSALPFAYRVPDEHPEKLEQAVRERMAEIGKRCEVADCRPHRLRDTFAVRMLLKGVAIDDVSKMLGHASVAVTQKYYSPWDPRRDARLERVAHEARSKS
jgi:integrase/recombinase XerD